MSEVDRARGVRERALSELERFHRRVDERAQAIARRHGPRLRCRAGCAGCCIDGLGVHAVEAERIRRAEPSLLRDARPHEAGACAFLDEADHCRVYAARPYVCRTQGLPLRWFESEPGGSVSETPVEKRDICPENLPGPALETLVDADCWLLGPAEAELAEIARAFTGGAEPPADRIPLRSLFAGGDEGEEA